MIAFGYWKLELDIYNIIVFRQMVQLKCYFSLTFSLMLSQ